MPEWNKHSKTNNKPLLGAVSALVALLLCAGTTTATAQHVYRCTEGGKTVYSDRACSDNAGAKRVNANANTIDRTEGRAQEERDAWRLEEQRANEREYWAQEHQRQSDVNQAASARVYDEAAHKKAFHHATTVLPGSKGGLTRGQRELAASLARTPQERAKVMLEATTVMRGAHGLTRSQVDTIRRLNEANAGRPMPPPTKWEDPPPPPMQAIAPVPAPEVPSHITSCDGAGCWDSSGRRYNNAAGGNSFRDDGKFCMQVGPNLQCN